MSFGFQVLEDSWDTSDDDPSMLIRTIDKVQLYEVSPVTFPAYPDTDISKRDIEGALESMKRARKTAKPRVRTRLMAAYRWLADTL